jgi:hypothetical protein
MGLHTPRSSSNLRTALYKAAASPTASDPTRSATPLTNNDPRQVQPQSHVCELWRSEEHNVPLACISHRAFRNPPQLRCTYGRILPVHLVYNALPAGGKEEPESVARRLHQTSMTQANASLA